MTGVDGKASHDVPAPDAVGALSPRISVLAAVLALA